MKTIYVGNIPFDLTEDQLREAFEVHGKVHSAKIVTDRATGRPRGFAFVEMDDANAASAIKAINETDMGGRSVRVNEAQEKADHPPRRPQKRY